MDHRRQPKYVSAGIEAANGDGGLIDETGEIQVSGEFEVFFDLSA